MKQNLSQKISSLRLSLRWTYASSKKLTLVIFLATVLTSSFAVIGPFIFKLLIDYITGEQGKIGLLLGLFGILLVYGVVQVIQGVIWDLQGLIKRLHAKHLDFHASRQLMEKVMRVRYDEFEDPEYYNTITRANENLWRVNDFFWQASFLFGQTLSALFIIAALGSFSWSVVLLTLCAAIPSLLLAIKANEQTYGLFYAGSPIGRSANYFKSLILNNKESIKEIKIFRLKNFIMNKYSNLFSSYIDTERKSVFVQLFIYVGVVILESIFSILAAYVIIKSFLSSNSTIGDVAFYLTLLFQFTEKTRWMIRGFSDLDSIATYTSPIVEALALPEEKQDENSKIIPMPKSIETICFEGVWFRYPRAKQYALRNISFTLNSKESIALVGENGSGKTTIVKLLCRLYNPTKGKITINGIDICSFDRSEYVSQIGVIFQEFMKYELQADENILISDVHTTSNKSVLSASKQANAHEFINRLPKQYKTHLGKTIYDDGTELSKGQWQKVALARAFYKDAKIIILDEPTAAVDAKAEYEIFKKFDVLVTGAISILVSHRFSTVRHAEKIIVLENGKIVEIGNHKKLLKNKKLYHELFTLQAEGYK